MDGTLIDHDGRIHPADAACLADLPAEVVFILATGRSLESAKLTFERLGLFKGQPIPLPLIMQNGALLYDHGEQILAYATFPPHDQPGLYELELAFPDVTFLFLNQHDIHMMNPSPYGQASAEKYHLRVRPFNNTSRHQSFSKVMCLSGDPARLAEVAAWCSSLAIAGVYSMPEIYELTPPGINKGYGLRKLLAMLGLSGAPLFVAGDGGNDLEMLAQADIAFTPISAPPEIQAKAGRVVDVRQSGLLAPMLAAAGIR
jgi:hypothetical protein